MCFLVLETQDKNGCVLYVLGDTNLNVFLKCFNEFLVE